MGQENHHKRGGGGGEGGLQTSRGRGALPRGRQIQKTFNNIKITILCGFVTILVLRGTIGVNLGSSDANAVNQHLIEETDRILAEICSDDAEDEPPSFQNPNATFSLGPEILNWDEEWRSWLLQNPQFLNFVGGKPRVLLLTGSPPKPCNNPIDEHYLLKSIKNKIDYCRLHDIEIVYNLAHLDVELADYWAHFDGYGDYPVERCLSSMEMAFNFADNQVLNLYASTPLQH